MANAQKLCQLQGATFYPEEDTFLFQFCGALREDSTDLIAKAGEVAHDLWWMNNRPRSSPSAESDSCPTGNVQVTIKIVNNYFGCFDDSRPSYFRITYSTPNGESATTESVAAGASKTLSISAWDGNQNGFADSIVLDISGSSDLDPNICASGQLGGEFLRNGDSWTVTLNADGTSTDTIVRGRESGTPTTAPQEPLKPIPDPRFTPSSK